MLGRLVVLALAELAVACSSSRGPVPRAREVADASIDAVEDAGRADVIAASEGGSEPAGAWPVDPGDGGALGWGGPACTAPGCPRGGMNAQ